MASSNDNPEVTRWKTKYFSQLDELEKKEADWVKSEQLLTKALTRISILAEGENPLIDHHLQGLRVVLKEKFSHYRIEAVLNELFNIVSDLEKKSSKKAAATRPDIDALIAVLDKIHFPKSLTKSKTALMQQLRSASAASELSGAVEALINAAIEKPAEEKPKGLLSRLFASDKRDTEILTLLSALISELPWPAKLKTEVLAVTKATAKVSTEEELEAVFKKLNSLVAQWPDSAGVVAAPTENTDAVKQQCLEQFVTTLKSYKPANVQLQSIKLSAGEIQSELQELASTLAGMIGQPAIVNTIAVPADNRTQPEIREVLIQLLEQLVVPVALIAKVEALKLFLESENSNDWRLVLKKVAQFINEVRFHQYQEDGNYENFLQQITGRLQEMVQFLEQENKQLQDSEKEGSELNQAVADEMQGLRQGVEQAVTLNELQGVVNSRLDAISNYVMQHRQLEVRRFGNASENLKKMQQRINALEEETFDLKLRIEEKNREAMYDALTGIPNRLFYDKRVSEDIARWKRFKTPLSLAVWDVDKFKSVNDTYGHKAGDKVLKTVAQILNKRIRETDFLARYGGEEFVMLLPGTVEEETLRLANELRQAVADCAFHYNNKAVEITISCGISGFREGDELGQVFERADRALYQAKESGRNRCVVSSCLT